MKKILLATLISLGFTNAYPQHSCGTSSEPYAVELQRRETLLQIKSSADYLPRTAGGITYVPIKMNLFGQNDGTQYADPDAINAALAELNKQFAPANIEFYFSGTAFSYFPNTAFNNSFESIGEFQDFHLANGATNAINVYVKSIVFLLGTNLAGYSSVTPNSQFSNRMVIQNFNLNDDNTTCHEFGHYFGLYHTFTEPGSPPGNDELVTRNFSETLPRLSANCDSKTDYICDTPADPHGQENASVSLCVNTGTATDANGDAYEPMLDNFMSYYKCRPFQFTPGQYARMGDGLLLVTNPEKDYTLDAPETIQNAPSNVVATFASYGYTLTWNDNSSSETGYIIERSTAIGGPFVPIAGVRANTTTLADIAGISGATNFFRIKPSNSKNNYSTVSAGVSAVFTCQNQNSQSCMPFYDTVVFSAMRIEDFTLSKNSMPLIENHDSGCSPNGTGDYFNIYNAVVTAGDVIQFNVKSKASQAGDAFDVQAKLYADWNQDNNFDPVTELVYSGAPANYQISGEFTVPNDIPSGSFRLRVGLASPYTVIEPCWIEGGEMEDYKLTNSLLNIDGNQANERISVSPNPVSQLLNINVPAGITLDKIIITDVFGKTIGLENGTAIDVEKLASGMYILQAFSEERKYVAKFIKQ